MLDADAPANRHACWHVLGSMITDLQLKRPPSNGPATAEQLHVMLSAWDHLALFFGSTISEVMTHTELTIPPPPTPAKARANMSPKMDLM
jgi:hypothetical protein